MTKFASLWWLAGFCFGGLAMADAQFVTADQVEDIAFPGHATHILADENSTPSTTAVLELHLAPESFGAPPHVHSHEDEHFYVLEGEVEFLESNRVVTASKGTLVTLPRGSMHGFWNQSNQPARLLMMVSPGQLAGFFDAVVQKIRQDHASTPDAVPGIIAQVATEFGVTIHPEAIPAEARALLEPRPRLVSTIHGLSGPEAVRYDPNQDVYFIANFNGAASGDANGFITKAGPEGEIIQREFMVGTQDHPLHGPRGMQIIGDDLIVADAQGVHVFDRHSGAHRNFVSFEEFEPAFLNDIAITTNGDWLVTDTSEDKPRLYRVREGEVTIVADKLHSPPNGITRIPESNRFVLAPWNGGQIFQVFDADRNQLNDFITMPAGGNFDGLEYLDGVLIIASQVDQTIWRHDSESTRPWFQVEGRPADLGLDVQRRRLAVPYISRDEVEIWQLPE